MRIHRICNILSLYFIFTYGLHVGFSQTSSHLGFGQRGLEHFQSQTGSAQTASHSGLGT